MIVYMSTNLTNNKMYIGLTTTTLEQRIASHKTDSKRKDTYFYRAIRKYGFESFRWDVLDTAKSVEELEEKEIMYIEKYGTFNNKEVGYNSTSGGYNLYDVTDELKQLRSQMASGENNPMYGVPSPNTGKKFTSEHKEKISQGLKNSYRPHVIGANNPSARRVKNVETREIFGTMTEAGKEYGTHRANIGNACRKPKATAKGYHWEYVN